MFLMVSEIPYVSGFVKQLLMVFAKPSDLESVTVSVIRYVLAFDLPFEKASVIPCGLVFVMGCA